MMHWSVLLNICLKDIRLLFADKAAVFFTLVFPLIMASFFGSVFSGEGKPAGMTLAIADLDQSAASAIYIDELSELDVFNVKLLEENIAIEKVRQGKFAAVLIIEQGYAEAKRHLFDSQIPAVRLGIDPSKKAAVGMLEGVLMAKAAKDMQTQFSNTAAMLNEVNKGLVQLDVSKVDRPELKNMLESVQQFMVSNNNNERSATDSANSNEPFLQSFNPLKITEQAISREKKGPENAYAVSFPQGMVWGIIGAITSYSLALISEVNAGTMGRLSIAPISRRTILGGKALACFLTIFFVCLILVAIAMLVFGVSIFSWSVLLATLLTCSLGFSGLMMLLATLGKTEKAASGISWAIVIVFAMTGGGMIPLIAMPSWMASLSDFSPIKWAVISFEGAFWRQFSIFDVMPYAAMLSLLGIVCFSLGALIFNKRELQ